MKKCGDHEIFITKICNYGIFNNFMKTLNHENLELYGTFVSNLFIGGISDQELTRHSGLLDLIESGDSVMADKGFDIRMTCLFVGVG